MDVDKYKVGIVIPSYQQGEYLERAINSVIDNMQHVSAKLVVMDGGSKDKSVEIIKKYGKYISYWESQEDGGQAAAVNKGIRYLRDCKYLMWLNSDDEYDNEYSVSQLVECADRENVAVCYGRSYFIDKNGKKIGEYKTKKFSLKRLNLECYLSQPSVLIERMVWEEEGGLNETLKMCLDYEFWIRLAKKYKFGYCDKVIGNTRMYEDTKTAMMQKRHLEEAICILQRYFEYVPMRWISAWWMQGKGVCVKSRILLWIIRCFLVFRKRKIIECIENNIGYKAVG